MMCIGVCYSTGSNNKKKIGSMAMEIVLPAMACLLMLTSCVCLVTICKLRGTYVHQESERQIPSYARVSVESLCTC
jgi:hypothetical protein